MKRKLVGAEAFCGRGRSPCSGICVHGKRVRWKTRLRINKCGARGGVRRKQGLSGVERFINHPVEFPDSVQIDALRVGGDEGGEVVATGTPEEVAKNRDSYTGEYLKKVL